MAEAKKRLLTYAGLKAIEDELENLKVVKRKEVGKRSSIWISVPYDLQWRGIPESGVY